MILEVAIVDVTDPDGFVAGYRRGRPHVAGTPGFRAMRVTQGIESLHRFVLLIEWDTVEAHTKNFRESERFTAWRAEISPYFDGAPVVEHFTDLD